MCFSCSLARLDLAQLCHQASASVSKCPAPTAFNGAFELIDREFSKTQEICKYYLLFFITEVVVTFRNLRSVGES